jgi:hypothetical protein
MQYVGGPITCPPGTSPCYSMSIDCSGGKCVGVGATCYITGCEKCGFATEEDPGNAGIPSIGKSGPWRVVVVNREKCASYCSLRWNSIKREMIPYCGNTPLR